MIVLDTNVVSELMRPAPAAPVVTWLRTKAVETLATTAITVAEIHFGLSRLPAGRRADELWRTADEILTTFETQVLPFDVAAAAVYGSIAADRERSGLPIDALDAQIAAICRTRGARLATRNTKDFTGTLVELLDPWVS